MSKVLGILESNAPSSHTLRLTFEQAADRVAHRIEVLDPLGHRLAQLHSKEGTSADEWPASPALQSCSLQEIRPGESAAFLIGMAGKSHWSASVEAIPSQGELRFDFACRINAQPDWLGSTYITGFPTNADSLHYPEMAIFRGSRSEIAAWIYGLDETVSGTQINGQELKLSCSENLLRFPQTLRWQYRICLKPNRI